MESCDTTPANTLPVASSWNGSLNCQVAIHITFISSVRFLCVHICAGFALWKDY